ncbi:hypothetical protein IT570_06320 [Candidatus Sumerlaeota bacterium]|nr:hypothetical protein [Candidatus Sumerlaeota bacterium]
MNPKEIPENLDLAQGLLGQWLRYRQFYYKGISKDPISPQEEAEFLEISSAIAQNTRKLVQRLNESEYPFRSNEITAQLRTAISVAHFRNLPAADQRIFYKDWHVSLIYLGRTVGALKFLAEGYSPPNGVSRPVGKKPGQASPGAKGPAPGAKGASKGGKAKKGGGGKGLKTIITVVVVIACLIGGYVLVGMFF